MHTWQGPDGLAVEDGPFKLESSHDNFERNKTARCTPGPYADLLRICCGSYPMRILPDRDRSRHKMPSIRMLTRIRRRGTIPGSAATRLKAVLGLVFSV